VAVGGLAYYALNIRPWGPPPDIYGLWMARENDESRTVVALTTETEDFFRPDQTIFSTCGR